MFFECSCYCARFAEFALHFRKRSGEWRINSLEEDIRMYKLNNLECGTQYEMYMTAQNKIGNSAPSELLVVSTNGSGDQLRILYSYRTWFIVISF